MPRYEKFQVISDPYIKGRFAVAGFWTEATDPKPTVHQDVLAEAIPTHQSALMIASIYEVTA